MRVFRWLGEEVPIARGVLVLVVLAAIGKALESAANGDWWPVAGLVIALIVGFALGIRDRHSEGNGVHA